MDSFDIKFSWYLWAGMHLEETTNSKKESLKIPLDKPKKDTA
jgi:hypothetical protein